MNREARDRLKEYLDHEGNADAQEDFTQLMIHMEQMYYALTDVRRAKAFDMLPRTVQDSVRKVTNHGQVGTP